MPLVRVLRPCVCVRPCCCFLLLLFSFLFSFCFFFFSCVCVFFCELFSNCQSRRFFWVVAKIFPRYETLHGAWGGPGLGLGLVRGLVRGSRCHMWSRQDFAFDLGSIPWTAPGPSRRLCVLPPSPSLRIDYRRFFNSIQQWYKSEEKKPHPTPEQPKMHKVDWVHDKKKETKKKTTRTLTVG